MGGGERATVNAQVRFASASAALLQIYRDCSVRHPRRKEGREVGGRQEGRIRLQGVLTLRLAFGLPPDGSN